MYFLILPWIITIIIEFLIIWGIIQKKPGKLFIYSLLINSITLPLATYSFNYFYSDLLVTEIVVVIVESVLLKILLETDYKIAFMISLAANTVTAVIGILVSL
jgi:hypothetical protein